MAKAKKVGAWLLVGAVVAVGAAWFYVKSGVEPTAPGGKPFLFRLDKTTPIGSALAKLEAGGAIRDARAMKIYGMFRRQPSLVVRGTYSVAPGTDADGVFKALTKPLRQMVRIPETNFSMRTGRLLAKYDVTPAEEYQKLVFSPAEFAKDVSFPLPADSLEGYLYPDTYDLPPLLGGKEVIERQLQAFEKKVYIPLHKPKDLQRLLTIASMVELETKLDSERPIVAGLIENRLKKKMPLQIDATILYAQGKWKNPTGSDVRNTISPYNTYKNKGLPPGPICSPSIKSIKAALHPAKHEYLYYVAMPEGNQLFSKTYAEHLLNIKKRKAALAKLKGANP